MHFTLYGKEMNWWHFHADITYQLQSAMALHPFLEEYKEGPSPYSRREEERE